MEQNIAYRRTLFMGGDSNANGIMGDIIIMRFAKRS